MHLLRGRRRHRQITLHHVTPIQLPFHFSVGRLLLPHHLPPLQPYRDPPSQPIRLNPLLGLPQRTLRVHAGVVLHGLVAGPHLLLDSSPLILSPPSLSLTGLRIAAQDISLAPSLHFHRLLIKEAQL